MSEADQIVSADLTHDEATLGRFTQAQYARLRERMLRREIYDRFRIVSVWFPAASHWESLQPWDFVAELIVEYDTQRSVSRAALAAARRYVAGQIASIDLELKFERLN